MYNHALTVPPYNACKSSVIVFFPSQGSSFELVEEALASKTTLSRAELVWAVKKNGDTLVPVGMAVVTTKCMTITPGGYLLS